MKQPIKSGVELIAEERARQINAEGWTPQHDDEHTMAELSFAARAYLGHAIGTQFGTAVKTTVPGEWPWAAKWWKPSGIAERDLIKAGALIAAEIDRLNRAQERTEAQE